jgi:hypothetical protein
MKNIRFPKLISVRITPIVFRCQIPNDMTPIKRGKLRKDGQPLTKATTNLITTHNL